MDVYYLAGDVSKGYCDFVILNKFKEVVEANFQLDDTPEGHCILIQTVKKIFAKDSGAEVYAGLESTGGYENNWYSTLFNLKNNCAFYVARLNPIGVSHHKKANMTRNGTDKISARAIAEYLIDHNKKIIYNKEDTMASLKKAWSYIAMLNKQCSQLLNQFETGMYTAHPHLLTYCKNEVPEWVLKVVIKYPTSRILSRSHPTTLAKIPFVTLVRAKELIENAKATIGSAQDEVTEFWIKSLAEQILNLRLLINAQTKMMMRFCPLPEIEILTSFVGIGKFSAVGLMLVIENIKRFESSKRLCSFVGIHPVSKQSGDNIFEIRMSKQGSKEARCILFNVAKSAIVHNDMIKGLYQYYQDKGKKKMSAIGILMHKIMRIIYGMLKNNQKYDPKVDEANRKKFIDGLEKNKAKETKPDKNRRLQEMDAQAPISQRQQKKRQAMTVTAITAQSLRKGNNIEEV